mgnify:CR=1 FL=1
MFSVCLLLMSLLPGVNFSDTFAYLFAVICPHYSLRGTFCVILQRIGVIQMFADGVKKARSWCSTHEAPVKAHGQHHGGFNHNFAIDRYRAFLDEAKRKA